MTARRTGNADAGGDRRLPLGIILGGLFTVLLIVTIFLFLGSDEGLADEYGSPTVTGSLPVLTDGADDPAVGAVSPEVAGADFDGTQVSITDDGRAKIIVFLAHWCPYCQEEVPVVEEWLSNTDLPEAVDFYSVATSINRSRENWPPSEWLEREAWPAPVLVDDRNSSVAQAFGLNAWPFWVFVQADGTILARTSGGVPPDVLDAVVFSLAQP